MTDATGALAGAAELLRTAESIVAVGHVRPDGDALGSALAIAIGARNAGASAQVTFGEPFAVPNQFRFLDTDLVVANDEIPDSFDLLVVCDTGVIDRLGSAASVAGRAKAVLVVDHHIPQGDFGDVRFIDSTSAATAEMAYRLIKTIGWELTESMAAALYVGLVTDTGRFQYSATTPAVHEMAADLLAAGVRPEVVGRHVYEETPFGFHKVAGAVLSRAELDESRSLVWSVLHESDLSDAGIGMEDTDGLIDMLRTAQEAGVACLLKVADGSVKGSLRSRGDVDVAAVAAEFGGGGHRNAAGFTFVGPPDAAIERIRRLLG